MRAIHILFYKPQSSDHWLNHLVTFFTPPFSHCDMQFEDEYASSIYQNESVYFEKKNFTRNNYVRVSLSFSDEEYSKIYEFCQKAHKSQVWFDPVGMIGSFLPFYFFTPTKKTFCSRYVIEALQQSERSDFCNLCSAKMNPSKLYFHLNEMNKSFLHVSRTRMINL